MLGSAPGKAAAGCVRAGPWRGGNEAEETAGQAVSTLVYGAEK